MYGTPTGSVLVTADRELIEAGKPVRVFNINLISSGTTGGSTIALLNGGATGTIYIKETGTVSTGKTFDYGINGHLFPSGCYVDVDANIVSALISCMKLPG